MDLNPYTLVDPPRREAVVAAIRHTLESGIPGDFVECGVYKGGICMLAAQTYQSLGEWRHLHLYDTFQGMTPPDPEKDGDQAVAQFHEGWCLGTLAEVRSNLRAVGVQPGQATYHVGPVETVLADPANRPRAISVLRLDTDWYSSTMAELVHLFPLLSPGGVLLVDDYGHWQGARTAVDDYFANLDLQPDWIHDDYTGVHWTKPA